MNKSKAGLEEAFLHELKDTHMLGCSGFRDILKRIRSSVITRKHADLRKLIEEDAKGLRMPNDQEVLSTLDHIKRQGVICNRSHAATTGGHAIATIVEQKCAAH